MTSAAATLARHTQAHAALRRDLAAIAGWFAVLSVAYWGAVLIGCGQVGFPLDDAYIHLQFARNLWADGQMAFNRGVPSSGSTAPLYPVLLAGVYFVVRDWHAASAILGGLCSLGTALVACGILRSWTGRTDLARWGGLLTVVMHPTVVQAYSGMESPAYSLVFLLGLWLYAAPRRRLVASAVLALGIWLRPEFVLLFPLICLERAVAACRGGQRRLATFLADVWPHVAVWTVVILAYVAYHWHQDRHLVPSTFAAKVVAPGAHRPPWRDGLPAALERGNLLYIFLSVAIWPLFVMATCGIGLTINCAPVGFGVREAALAAWRDQGSAAAGRRLALITLIGYPWLRGFVDPAALVWYQFQRYYAHLTPLIIVIVIGALPTTRVLLQRPFWHWGGTALRAARRRTVLWAGACLSVTGAMAVVSVSNITSMQIPIGRWVREHTSAGQLIATNDIGAIAFVSERPILDTIGLIEPEIVEHYLNGGELLEYLQARDPAYVIIFPEWYEQLSSRGDLLEPVHSVALDFNMICGGPEMVVYRPKWNDAQDE